MDIAHLIVTIVKKLPSAAYKLWPLSLNGPVRQKLEQNLAEAQNAAPHEIISLFETFYAAFPRQKSIEPDRYRMIVAVALYFYIKLEERAGVVSKHLNAALERTRKWEAGEGRDPDSLCWLDRCIAALLGNGQFPEDVRELSREQCEYRKILYQSEVFGRENHLDFWRPTGEEGDPGVLLIHVTGYHGRGQDAVRSRIPNQRFKDWFMQMQSLHPQLKFSLSVMPCPYDDLYPYLFERVEVLLLDEILASIQSGTGLGISYEGLHLSGYSKGGFYSFLMALKAKNLLGLSLNASANTDILRKRIKTKREIGALENASVSITCGIRDNLYKANRMLYKTLQDLRVSVDFNTHGGGHEWESAASAFESSFLRTVGMGKTATDSPAPKNIINEILEGNLSGVQNYLAGGGQVEGSPHDGWTTPRDSPLYHAALKGHVNIMQALVNAGANVNKGSGPLWEPPLIAAAKGGSLDAVIFLIVNGADINGTDKYHYIPPLMSAASCGHNAIVDYLLKKGADIHQTDRYGNSALVIGAVNGHPDIVRLLIDHGAEVNTIDSLGNTPLARLNIGPENRSVEEKDAINRCAKIIRECGGVEKGPATRQ